MRWPIVAGGYNVFRNVISRQIKKLQKVLEYLFSVSSREKIMQNSPANITRSLANNKVCKILDDQSELVDERLRTGQLLQRYPLSRHGL